MLVLTRRIGEEIIIPELGVTVKVVKRDGKNVRLGITAPETVRIERSEKLQQTTLREQNRPAKRRRNSSAVAGS